MFKRGIETISDLGIGRLSCLKKSQIWNANACLKNFSIEDLEIIYNLIQKKTISLDNVHASTMSYSEWVDFNNKIVNGLKAGRRRKAKVAEFVKGDVVAVMINGKEYKGFVAFHNYQTRTKTIEKMEIDNNGRIRAYNNDCTFNFTLKSARKVEGEEKELWIKEYNERFSAQKIENLKKDIERLERWLKIRPDEYYEDQLKKYKEELLTLTK